MMAVAVADGEWVALGDFLPAADHLQMLSLHRETGVLELADGDCSGRLYLRQGDVVDAECAGRSVSGMEASLCLLCLQDARCRYHRGEHGRERVIHESTPALLMEAAQWSDEHRTSPGCESVLDGAPSSGCVLMIDCGPEGRAVPLEAGRLGIGRGPECEVVILHRSVSRRHAEIQVEGGKMVLRDLGSTNGTLVNGHAIREAHVALDDEIGFGDVRARVMTKADAMTERKTELLSLPNAVAYAETRNIRGDHPTARKPTGYAK